MEKLLGLKSTKKIDKFTNMFEFYACLQHKGCSRKRENLHEICPTEQQLIIICKLIPRIEIYS